MAKDVSLGLKSSAREILREQAGLAEMEARIREVETRGSLFDDRTRNLNTSLQETTTKVHVRYKQQDKYMHHISIPLDTRHKYEQTNKQTSKKKNCFHPSRSSSPPSRTAARA